MTRILAYKVGRELLDGSLQCVLVEFEEPPVPIHLLHTEGRQVSAKVRAFIDMAVEQLGQNKFLQ